MAFDHRGTQLRKYFRPNSLYSMAEWVEFESFKHLNGQWTDEFIIFRSEEDEIMSQNGDSQRGKERKSKWLPANVTENLSSEWNTPPSGGPKNA